MIQQTNKNLKIIYITGGVVSSIGKGITASSIGALLTDGGFKVRIRKFEPYLNIDSNTLSPEQHGEVFVTPDGSVTDMDIGNYYRFTNLTPDKHDYITSGKIFQEVLNNERKGKYLGSTVQFIPHVTDLICASFTANLDEDLDFLICEIGGTVGDIEISLFLEATRQMRIRHKNIMFIHIGLMPFLQTSQEYKTKPIQHSVNELRKSGIEPNMILCRSNSNAHTDTSCKKIAMFSNLDPQYVIPIPTLNSAYEICGAYKNLRVNRIIYEHFNVVPRVTKTRNTLPYETTSPLIEVNLGIVSKYTNHADSHYFLHQALKDVGVHSKYKINITYLDAETVPVETLKSYDGVIVAGGFGVRGAEGKINALQYLRNTSIPTLGICFGMQLMMIETLRNLEGITDANSSEFSSEGSIIIKQNKNQVMFLGAQQCNITDTFSKIYNRTEIQETHRHRYSFNLDYLDIIQKHYSITAWDTDRKVVEGIILKTHPWFVGVQYHPELRASMHKPHPLLEEFINQAVTYKNTQQLTSSFGPVKAHPNN